MHGSDRTVASRTEMPLQGLQTELGGKITAGPGAATVPTSACTPPVGREAGRT